MNKNISSFSTLTFLSLLIGLSFSCKKPTEPDTNPGFSISVEDVSCVEAWVRVKSNGMPLPADIVITKNDAPALTFTMSNTDTVVMIDSLLPKQTYTFRAFRSDKTQAIATAECATMDTTSHNFTWQTFTFGEHNSSLLYDVAIIDENNIWAVGNIYMNDSLGQADSKRYNAIHWDGMAWKLHRVPYIYNGTNIHHPIYTIYSFSADNIWFGGNGIINWNGLKYNPIEMPQDAWGPFEVYKLWGTSPTNMYAVGENGSIARWDGFNWRKIESGTQIPLTGISGTSDGAKIWVSGWNVNSGMTALLTLSDNTVKKIYEHNISNSPPPFNSYITGVWYDGTSECWMTGADGVVKLPVLYTGPLRHQQFPVTYFPRSLSGGGKNNVVIGCDRATLWHYNGLSWWTYPEMLNTEYRIRSIKISKNTLVAVGYRYLGGLAKALIIIGKKN